MTFIGTHFKARTTVLASYPGHFRLMKNCLGTTVDAFPFIPMKPYFPYHAIVIFMFYLVIKTSGRRRLRRHWTKSRDYGSDTEWGIGKFSKAIAEGILCSSLLLKSEQIEAIWHV